jgi:replicative DNA helicase
MPPDVKPYAEVIYHLMENGSHMTPEVVELELAKRVGDLNTSLFMEEVKESQSTPAQVRELHNYILNDYVAENAGNVLKGLAGEIRKPGVVDLALNKLRELKSLEPSKTVSFGGQFSGALRESFDGHKQLIKYGFPTFDRRLGGGTRGEITIIAGRPGHGKTTFSLQLLINWMHMGYKIIFFSLEMPTHKLIHKMLSNQAKVDSYNIRTGKLNDDEKHRMTTAAENLVHKFTDTVLIYEDVYRLREMETIIAKHRPDVVVVDFIQLMEMNSSYQRTEIFNIMRNFKQIVKEYNFNLTALSQLNRTIENREDPVPRLSDLAESGSLEQLAGDCAFVFYPHKLDQDKPKNLIEVYFLKTRYGELSKFELLFDGATMTYKERGYRKIEAEEVEDVKRGEEGADRDAID